MRPALCLILAAAFLFVAGRTGVGDPLFLPATVACGLVLLSGSRFPPRPAAPLIDATRGLVVGTMLLLPCALGAALLWMIPPLHPLTEQVGDLIGHNPPDPATFLGLLAVVLLNAPAEELFFRGTLPRYFPTHPVLAPVALYAAMTTVFGVVLLPLAAVLLGLAMHFLRARTGGLTAPIVAHLLWTCSMIGVVAALEWRL